eukprot:2382276-Alexandrium_andersonii.AAC.1
MPPRPRTGRRRGKSAGTATTAGAREASQGRRPHAGCSYHAQAPLDLRPGDDLVSGPPRTLPR